MKDTLQRWAAVVPVFVEAGCDRPPEYLQIEEYVGDYAALIWPEMHDDHSLVDVHEYIHNDRAAIAVLEQWFSQTVVPWADCEEGVLCGPPYWAEGVWVWHVSGEVGQHPSPTESFIQCAEALAGVIGGKQ